MKCIGDELWESQLLSEQGRWMVQTGKLVLYIVRRNALHVLDNLYSTFLLVDRES